MEVGKERKRTEETEKQGRKDKSGGRKARRKSRKEKGRKEGQDNKTTERQRRRNEGEEETGGEERTEDTKEEQDGGTEGGATGGGLQQPIHNRWCDCSASVQNNPTPTPHNPPHAATPHNTVS